MRTILVRYETGKEREKLQKRLKEMEREQDKGYLVRGKEIKQSIPIQDDRGVRVEVDEYKIEIYNCRKVQKSKDYKKSCEVEYTVEEFLERGIRGIQEKQRERLKSRGYEPRWMVDIWAEEAVTLVLMYVKEDVVDKRGVGYGELPKEIAKRKEEIREINRKRARRLKEVLEDYIEELGGTIRGLDEKIADIKEEALKEALEGREEELEGNVKGDNKNETEGVLEPLRVLLVYRETAKVGEIKEKIKQRYRGSVERKHENSSKFKRIDIRGQCEIYVINERKENKKRKVEKYRIDKEIDIEGREPEDIIYEMSMLEYLVKDREKMGVKRERREKGRERVYKERKRRAEDEIERTKERIKRLEGVKEIEVNVEYKGETLEELPKEEEMLRK